MLYHPNDDITYQVLACFNVLLYLGNEDAQKKISDTNSEQDLSLIIQVQKILKRAQINLNKAKYIKINDNYNTVCIHNRMQGMSTEEESSSLEMVNL